MSHALTKDLCKALGLPKMTTRAVLTLAAGEPPRLQIEMLATDSKGKPIVETSAGEYGEGVARRLATVQFMVRLEPFSQ